MGVNASQPADDTVSTSVVIAANMGTMLLFPVHLPASFEKQQVNTAAVYNGIEVIRTHLAEVHERKRARSLCCWFTASIIGVVPGFMCGFLMSFLGGANGQTGVLATGIFFVVVFFVSLVGLFASVTRINALQQALFNRAQRELQPVLRTLNSQYSPYIQFATINTLRKGLELTITAGTKGNPLPVHLRIADPPATLLVEPPLASTFVAPAHYVPASAPPFVPAPQYMAGYPHPEAQEPPAYEEPSGMLCASCKHSNVPGSIFCARCGSRL